MINPEVRRAYEFVENKHGSLYIISTHSSSYVTRLRSDLGGHVIRVLLLKLQFGRTVAVYLCYTVCQVKLMCIKAQTLSSLV